jgi:transcriptional regulator with XRE-family HTH domain
MKQKETRTITAKNELGAQLRKLRKDRGLTGQQLAAATGVSQGTISKVETGAQAPDMDLLIKLAGALKLSKHETAQLISDSSLVGGQRAAQRVAEVVPFDFLQSGEAASRQTVGAHWEQDASEIREFAPTLIPGLLQTAEYARDAIRLSGVSRQAEIEEGVQARLRRQKLLRRRKHFHFVLSEAALRSRITDGKATRSQLQHLRSLSKQSQVRIGVIPWSARLPVWLPPNFAVFDEALAYVELPHGELLLREAGPIQTYLGLFDSLAAAAVYDGDFHATLARIQADTKELTDAERAVRPRLR